MSPDVSAIVARQRALDALLARTRPLRTLPRPVARRAILLWRVLDLWLPAEVNPDRVPLVHALAAAPWVRPAASWRGADLRGLVHHLLVGVRFPLPEFLWTEVLTSAHPPVPLLAHLGAGRSVVAAGRAGLLPRLTRAQAHRWLLSRGPAIRAAREAQMGDAPTWLADAVDQSFLREVQRDERPWGRMLRWLAAGAAEVPPDRAGALLEHLRRCPPAVCRRPVRAVLRDVGEPWSTLLARSLDERFRASGVPGGPIEGAWTIRELRRSFELYVEGRVLHHCVATYAPRVRAGKCAIFGLRLAGQRRVTVEVALPDRAIVQVRGDRNRMPCDEEKRVLTAWAAAAEIGVRRW